MKDTKYTEIRKFILSKSFDLGIKMDDILRYDEEHRYYHNMEHIVDMVSIAKDLNISRAYVLSLIYKPEAKQFIK